MGYTPFHTDLLIGLGTSAISDAWTAFAQNEKTVEDYQNRVEAGELPFFRGHLLNEEDAIIRKHILDLMCHFQTTWNEPNSLLADAIIRLQPMIEDELVEVTANSIKVTKTGEPFVRNVCMALDSKEVSSLNIMNISQPIKKKLTNKKLSKPIQTRNKQRSTIKHNNIT